MNPRLLRHVLAFTATICFAVPVKAEDTTTHRFGETIYVQGDSFDWISAQMSGDIRYDYYEDTNNNQVTLTSRPDVSTTLALVSGTSSQGGVDGLMESGNYLDNYEWNDDGMGNWNSTSYSVDLALGQVTTYSESYSDDGSGNTYYSESWSNSLGQWGWESTQYSTDPYSGSGSSTYTSWDSWNEGPGWNSESTGYIDYLSAGYYLENLLGSNWNFMSGDYHQISNSDGYSLYSNNYSYYNDNSGNMNIVERVENGVTTVEIQAMDAHIGSCSGSADITFDAFLQDFNLINWEPRTSASFGYSHFWLNGLLYTWQEGVLSSNGEVADSYNSANGSTAVEIKADICQFKSGAGSAIMRFSGTTTTDTIGSINFPNQININDGYLVVVINNEQTSASPFFITAGSLWLNQFEYEFQSGYIDSNGHRMDLFRNEGKGSIMLTGSVQGTAAIGGQFETQYFSGNLSSSLFEVSNGFTLSDVQPPQIEYPGALWVRGRVYVQQGTLTGGGMGYQSINSGEVYGALQMRHDESDEAYEIEGNDSEGGFSGSFGDTTDSIAMIQAIPAQGSAPSPVLVIFLDWNQATESATIPQQAGGRLEILPPCVAVAGLLYEYAGAVAADGQEVNAVYVKSTELSMAKVLFIRHQPEEGGELHAVTLNNSEFTTARVGKYNAATRLFQTEWQLPPESRLPFYVYPVNPCNNHTIWLTPFPESPAGSQALPPSFRVWGEAWWFAGVIDGTAIYEGFYSGQRLEVSAPDAEGMRLVQLVDPVRSDTPTQGTLSNLRGSVRMRDGTLVYSGDIHGLRIDPVLADHRLHTIDADLDITGNVLSFGSLNDAAAVAGVTMQFFDDGSKATLASALSRPQAEWKWYRASVHSGFNYPAAPMMELDNLNSLRLFDPGNQQPTEPPVIIAPGSGEVSKIPKLELTSQTLESPGSVLTSSLADGRYAQLSALSDYATTSALTVLHDTLENYATITDMNNIEVELAQAVKRDENGRVSVAGPLHSSSDLVVGDVESEDKVTIAGGTTTTQGLIVNGQADFNGATFVSGVLILEQAAGGIAVAEEFGGPPSN